MPLNLENIDLGSFGVSKDDEPQPNPQLRSSLSEAVKVNPDSAAKVNQLSSASGIPAFAVEQDPVSVETKLNLDKIDFSTMSKRSPNTSKFLTDFNNASIAHDDVGILESIEGVFDFSKVFQNFGESTRLSFSSQLKGLQAQGVDATPARIQDLIPMSAMPIGMELEAPQMSEEYAARFGITSDEQLQEARQEAEERIISELKDLQEQKNVLEPEDLNILEQGVRSGVQSLVNMAPGVGLMVLSGGRAAPLLTTMGIQTYGEAYGSARADGLEPDVAQWYATIDATIEVGTEMLPTGTLERIITGKSGGVTKEALKFMVQEMGTEQLATLGQSINAYAFGLDEELEKAETVSEMVDVQLRRQAVTAIATVVAGGAQAGAVSGINKTIAALSRDQQQAETKGQVEQDKIDQLNAASVDSKLKQRDAESFKQFINEADGDQNTTVFIDGAQAALYLSSKNRAEIDKDPALQLIRDQVNEASRLGTDVAIPAADFAATVAGTPHFDALREDMTLSADSVSPFRAEQVQQETRQYVQTLMSQAQENVSQYVEAQQIYDTVRTQLIDTGMVTPQNASTMAQLVPAWATVHAQQNGMTVQEVYQQSGLTIEGPQTGRMEEVTGQVLEQRARDFKAQLQQEFPDVKFGFSQTGNVTTLDKIIVPEDQRTAGTGTAAIQRIVDWADQNGQTVALTPSADFGGSKKRLTDFYKRFGFVENKGRNKDFEISESMYRPAAEVLTQRPDGAPEARGYYDPANAVIRLTEAADLSTFLHEFAHFMYEMERKAGSETSQKIGQWFKRNADDVAKEANSYLSDERESLAQSAFHGTPHKFDRFSLEAIGTGEGAQAYGWGLYFASSRKIAEYYRDTLSGAINQFGQRDLSKRTTMVGDTPAKDISQDVWEVADHLASRNVTLDEYVSTLIERRDTAVNEARAETIQELIDQAENVRSDLENKRVWFKSTGELYQVDIPESDQLLDWDKPLSQQPEAVRDAISEMSETEMRNPDDMTDQEIATLIEQVDSNADTEGLNRETLIQLAESMDAFEYQAEPINQNQTGQSAYLRLVAKHGSDKAASEFLNSIGIPGLRYLDATSRGGQDEDSHNFVIWDEQTVTVEAVNDEQRQADLLAQSPEIPGQLEGGAVTAEDVRNFVDTNTTGDKGKDRAIYRAIHEQFARGFETYLMEGTAPSIELRNAFRSFARWLTQIYRAIKGNLKVNLDAEMRQVFDRMLATEDQIAAAEARARYEPMFTDAAMAGMTEKEFAAYKKRQEKVKDKQSETLREKLIKELTRKTEAWWKEEKADLVAEEIESLQDQPVYVAANRLRTGDLKLDYVAVREMTGEERTDKLGRKRTHLPSELNKMTVKGGEGVHPDEAAAFFGYNSGDEMLTDIITAPKIKDLAESNAEKRMLEKHGDILNDGTIEQQADEAVQNEERGKLILAELKALSKGTNQPVFERQIIKALAEERIGQLAFREIFPARYRKAEIKAAQESARMLAEGNREGAAGAKARQVLNYYLGMAATAAKSDTMNIVDRMGRYNTKRVREAIQKADGGYWDQIVKILGRFEFRKSATLKEVQDINTWMRDRIEQDGDGLVLSPEVLNESMVTHWKNVPFSQLQGIADSVKNIEHVARYANKIDVLQEKMDFDTLVSSWTDHIKSISTKYTTKESRSRAEDVSREGFTEKVNKFISQMTKVPFLASWLDGGERVGMSHDIMVQRFTDALNDKLNLMDEVARPVYDMILKRDKETRARHLKKIHIPEINDDLYGHQVLAVALNTGNQSNLKKMLLGEGWANPENEAEISFNNPKLQAVLQHMTRADWVMVQKIWDQMELLYPQLAEVHRRTTGLVPPKIESTPIQTPYGEFKGGYYPVKYSPKRGYDAEKNAEKQQAETESMFSNYSSINASVNAGATNERTGFYAPILLDLSVIPDHFHETIHFITHHDAVRQMNKLINDKRVQSAITGAVGEEEFKQLKPWINDIAKDGREQPTKTFIHRAFNQLRFGVTLGAMGFKASTGIMQFFGLFTTAAELGVGPTIKGVRSAIGGAWYMRAIRKTLGSTSNMESSWKFASDKSKVLKHRTDTMDREIRAAMERLSGKRGFIAATQEVSMKHIALIQTYMVDMPTWFAAYDKTISETGDETKAVNYADWAVENLQGSGATKDMAQILRNQDKIHTTFTMFMTFFSSLGNLSRDTYRGAKDGKYSLTNTAAKLMFLYTLPVFVEMLMRGEFEEPEDEDERLQKFLTNLALYPVASVPFARDVASGVFSEYGYNVTPVASLLERGITGYKQIGERAFTDEEITAGALKGAVKLTGAAFGIPGVNQAWSTGEHLYDVIEEGEDLTLRQVLFGPDRE